MDHCLRTVLHGFVVVLWCSTCTCTFDRLALGAFHDAKQFCGPPAAELQRYMLSLLFVASRDTISCVHVRSVAHAGFDLALFYSGVRQIHVFFL